MPASRRSRIGRTISGRLNMRTPIFAVCRNLGFAAISFTAAGADERCRIRRIPQDARRMRDEHFPKGVNGRLRMGMALRGPCFTSAERNAEDFKFARELGLPISTHVGMAGTSDAIMCSIGSACWARCQLRPRQYVDRQRVRS
jgi:cytosine/adenosine deaminase-related metal-dependent hydrolase